MADKLSQFMKTKLMKHQIIGIHYLLKATRSPFSYKPSYLIICPVDAVGSPSSHNGVFLSPSSVGLILNKDEGITNAFLNNTVSDSPGTIVLLSDEMGLGKTLTALAAIKLLQIVAPQDLNHHDFLPRKTYVEASTVRWFPQGLDSQYGNDNFLHLPLSQAPACSCLERFTPTIANDFDRIQIPSVFHFDGDIKGACGRADVCGQLWVVCDRCYHHFHAKCVGLDHITEDNMDWYMNHVRHGWYCPFCQYTVLSQPDEHQLALGHTHANAALIVVPASLVDQWCDEIDRHFHPGTFEVKKVLKLNTESINSILSWIHNLRFSGLNNSGFSPYPLVIVSDKFLADEYNAWAGAGYHLSPRAMRPKAVKYPPPNPPVIAGLEFDLVAVDEAQTFSRGRHGVLAQELKGVARWNITGTPFRSLSISVEFQTDFWETFGNNESIKRLKTYFNILVNSFNENLMCQNSMARRPWHIWARNKMVDCLSELMLRRTLDYVKNELCLPPMIVHDLQLSLSPAESTLYAWMLEDLIKSALPPEIYTVLASDGLFLYGNWRGSLDFFGSLIQCMESHENRSNTERQFAVTTTVDADATRWLSKTETSDALLLTVDYFINREHEWHIMSSELLGLRRIFIRPSSSRDIRQQRTRTNRLTATRRRRHQPRDAMTTQGEFTLNQSLGSNLNDNDLPCVLRGMRARAKREAEKSLRELSSARCVLARLNVLKNTPDAIQKGVVAYEDVLYSSGAIRRAIRGIDEHQGEQSHEDIIKLCGWSGSGDSKSSKDTRLRIDPTVVIHICGALLNLMVTRDETQLQFRYSKSVLERLNASCEYELIQSSLMDMTLRFSALCKFLNSIAKFHSTGSSTLDNERSTPGDIERILSPGSIQQDWPAPPIPLVTGKGRAGRDIKSIAPSSMVWGRGVVFKKPSSPNNLNTFWTELDIVFSEYSPASSPEETGGYFRSSFNTIGRLAGDSIGTDTINIRMGLKIDHYIHRRESILELFTSLPVVSTTKSLLLSSLAGTNANINDDTFNNVIDRIQSCTFCRHIGNSVTDEPDEDEGRKTMAMRRRENMFTVRGSGTSVGKRFKNLMVPRSTLCDLCLFRIQLNGVIRYFVNFDYSQARNINEAVELAEHQVIPGGQPTQDSESAKEDASSDSENKVHDYSARKLGSEAPLVDTSEHELISVMPLRYLPNGISRLRDMSSSHHLYASPFLRALMIIDPLLSLAPIDSANSDSKNGSANSNPFATAWLQECRLMLFLNDIVQHCQEFVLLRDLIAQSRRYLRLPTEAEIENRSKEDHKRKQQESNEDRLIIWPEKQAMLETENEHALVQYQSELKRKSQRLTYLMNLDIAVEASETEGCEDIMSPKATVHDCPICLNGYQAGGNQVDSGHVLVMNPKCAHILHASCFLDYVRVEAVTKRKLTSPGEQEAMLASELKNTDSASMDSIMKYRALIFDRYGVNSQLKMIKCPICRMHASVASFIWIPRFLELSVDARLHDDTQQRNEQISTTAQPTPMGHSVVPKNMTSPMLFNPVLNEELEYCADNRYGAGYRYKGLPRCLRVTPETKLLPTKVQLLLSTICWINDNQAINCPSHGLEATKLLWEDTGDNSRTTCMTDTCTKNIYRSPKVVVYTEFAANATYLSTVLANAGHRVYLFDGRSKGSKQWKKGLGLWQFMHDEDPNSPTVCTTNVSVLLLHTSQAGRGLSLSVVANHLILIDAIGSFELELQVMGRIRRIGQIYTQHIWRLYLLKTIEMLLVRTPPTTLMNLNQTD